MRNSIRFASVVILSVLLIGCLGVGRQTGNTDD